MHLSHLSLTNFRNFLQLELDLPPGAVVLHGGNAQGKTGLLEAIYLLVIAKSFRAENEYEVVNWQAAREEGNALVGGTIEKQDERLRVFIGYQCLPRRETQPATSRLGDHTVGVRKQIRVSRVKRTAAELIGMVTAVLFTAQDIDLVQGPPSIRRRYLDILLSQVDRSYFRSLQRYQRVLQQRNRLLKQIQERRAEVLELAFWDEELVKDGSWITDRRAEAMAALFALCRERHGELTGGRENFSLEYKPRVTPGITGPGEDTRSEFMAALEASRNREVRLGSTVVGPHRDDFALIVNDVDMGPYASRGQARTLALTLRLAEAEYLASARGEGPIVLLDDVLSEMDSFRRARVLEKAAQYQQMIITTTDPEIIQRDAFDSAAYYQVDGGRVSPTPPPADVM